MSAMPKEIAEAINAIMSSVDYIEKRGENTHHNYRFAAVGDVLAKLQPAMAKEGLIIVQHEINHELMANDSVMTASYQFILCHKSGAIWDTNAVHTGMAAGRNSKGGFDDKALNKCHTAARKYFLLSLFQIPTGDLPDADAEEDRPSVATEKGAPKRTVAPKKMSPRERAEEWVAGAKAALLEIKMKGQLTEWSEKNKRVLAKLADEHTDLSDHLATFITERYDELAEQENA